MPDLPPGKWSALLVGPWWPAPPAVLQNAAAHWTGQGQALSNAAVDVQNLTVQLGVNKGATANDVIDKHGSLGKLVENAGADSVVKSDETAKVAKAVEELRKELTDIATRGNAKIDSIMSKKGSLAEKLVEVNAVIFESNTEAINASAGAMSSITRSLASLLHRLDMGGSAAEWLASHGAGPGDNPPRTTPLTEDGLKSALGNDAPASGGGRDTSPGPSSHEGSGAAQPASAGGRGSQPAPPATEGTQPASAGGRDELPSHGVPSPAAPTAPAGGGGTHLPGVGGGHLPGAGGGLPGGGLSPAALGNGLSPSSLGHSFDSGLQAGQPAAAGAQSLAGGAVHAAAPPPPAAPPPVAPHAIPTLAANGGGAPVAPTEHIAPASSAPAVSGGYASPSPTVLAAPMGAPAAPVGGAPVAPVGPLPAYGADLRPMTPVPPVAPSVPAAGPVAGGAPVAASPASSPAAGGLVSPVERSTPAASSAAQANGSAAGAGLVSATAGAVAGDAAKRGAVERDLQKTVDAVARQEPAIAWAAGLLDDDTTTLLTTDLAGGWIPPHVKLPAGITLLAPAARRRDLNAVALLGAPRVDAAYEPHRYIAATGPGDPALTGERARHGPRVDELGPTLVDAVTRRSGLPAFMQGVAKAATRRTGVYETEVAQLQDALHALRRDVIAAYAARKHELAELVANWMLLAAIEAIVDGHDDISHYHMAWYTASFATTGRR